MVIFMVGLVAIIMHVVVTCASQKVYISLSQPSNLPYHGGCHTPDGGVVDIFRDNKCLF